MSISLEEARRKLDILEEISNNPELALTELFTEGVSGSNFLYQVDVNGKYILDCLNEQLIKLAAFSDCKIKNSAYELKISVEPIRVGEYAAYMGNDDILKIDADERTYKVLNKDISEYKEIMNKKYTFEKKELEDFWYKFMNLTFKKRVKNSLESLASNKKLSLRLSDSMMWFFIRNKKITKRLSEVIKDIDETNEYRMKIYEGEIERQNYYRLYAPKHIDFIKYKQKEISNYLLSIGYKEDNDLSDY